MEMRTVLKNNWFRPFPCYNKQIERQEAAEEELQDRKRRQRAGNRRNGQNCRDKQQKGWRDTRKQ